MHANPSTAQPCAPITDQHKTLALFLEQLKTPFYPDKTNESTLVRLATEAASMQKNRSDNTFNHVSIPSFDSSMQAIHSIRQAIALFIMRTTELRLQQFSQDNFPAFAETTKQIHQLVQDSKHHLALAEAARGRLMFICCSHKGESA